MAASTDIRTLSVIVPVYNEVQTVVSVIALVHAVDVHGLRKEIIVVDDGSTDGTREALEPMRVDGTVRLICQPTNRGKGAAVRTGLAHATGDLIIVGSPGTELEFAL